MSTETSSLPGSSRIGLRLFAVYTLFYTGFVLVNAFAPQWSEWVLLGGINLAVLWGFALIGLAFVLALIYGVVRSGEDRTSLAALKASAKDSDPSAVEDSSSNRGEAE